MKDEARPTEGTHELQMRQEFQKQQEDWEQVSKIIKSLSLELLVAAYRYNVNEQRRMALIPDRSIEILLQQEHNAARAERALQELKSRGLPMAVSLRAASAWHQSDTDWTSTQRQIEQWVDPNQPPRPDAPPVKEKKLTPREMDVLRAFYQAKPPAVSQSSLMKIASTAGAIGDHRTLIQSVEIGKGEDDNFLRRLCRGLKTDNYLESMQGPLGGYWLTEKGIKAVQINSARIGHE